MAIQISGTTVIDNSRNLTNIANASTLNCANTYVIRNASGGICVSSTSIPIGAATPLGTFVEGGYLICKSGPGIAWIVAPSTYEVTRNWYARNNAVTVAQSASGCTGWFIPTYTQLQNPGNTCRVYWDSYSSTYYWSSTEGGSTIACILHIENTGCGAANKSSSYCVRAFRCVSY